MFKTPCLKNLLILSALNFIITLPISLTWIIIFEDYRVIYFYLYPYNYLPALLTDIELDTVAITAKIVPELCFLVWFFFSVPVLKNITDYFKNQNKVWEEQNYKPDLLEFFTIISDLLEDEIYYRVDTYRKLRRGEKVNLNTYNIKFRHIIFFYIGVQSDVAPFLLNVLKEYLRVKHSIELNL